MNVKTFAYETATRHDMKNFVVLSINADVDV